MSDLCVICEKQASKRVCPGTRVADVLVGDTRTPVGDICPVCCGKQRENSIDCPLDCNYLRAARRREPRGITDPEQIPNREIDVSEQFLRQHEVEFLRVGQALAEVMIAERSVDSQGAEAVERLIQDYKASEAIPIHGSAPGVTKEGAFEDAGARQIYDSLKKSIVDLKEKFTAEKGVDSLQDAVVLKLLVFLQRLILQHGNGRARGRTFFEFQLAFFAAPPTGPDPVAGTNPEASPAR